VTPTIQRLRPTPRSPRSSLHQPLPIGSAVTQTLDRAGQVGNDPALARYGVTAALLVSETGRTVASVFWSFMNSRGTVYTGWRFREDALFPNPFYATGFPITEPYWTRVRVGGTPRDVLVQCFERRCLTYTPDNPPGWQVEAGNVGQHYYRWRYEQLGQPVQEAGVYQLATVTNVVDGDTIDVRFTDGRTARIRLIGVDTPEVYGEVECFGVAASQFTAEWLAGKEVALQRDVSETDRYGRLLRYVWIGPYLFNEVLVRRGYAGVATYPPDVAYAGRFVEAERAAREERAGLWGICPIPPVGRDTEPAPPPGPAPSPSPTPTPAPNCDPSYPTVCIPPPPPDLDCADIPSVVSRSSHPIRIASTRTATASVARADSSDTDESGNAPLSAPLARPTGHGIMIQDCTDSAVARVTGEDRGGSSVSTAATGRLGSTRHRRTPPASSPRPSGRTRSRSQHGE
jgi:endonuclease YncB( thermonuclease family)